MVIFTLKEGERLLMNRASTGEVMKQSVIPFDRIDPAQIVIDLLPAIMIPELIFQLFSGQGAADPDD